MHYDLAFSLIREIHWKWHLTLLTLLSGSV